VKLLVQGLQKSYDEKQVLTNVTYTFEQGRIYGLLGRNGAGKTTMLNCLAGHTECSGGSVQISADDGRILPLGYNDVGFVFTQPQLPEFMTGYEFIKYFVEINEDKIHGNVDINEHFDKIDINEADRHRLIKDYSHGMKNKVQILASLILRPRVILLDEPLTSFDVVVALEIKNLIKSIKSEHIIIFSTHILQLAQDMCDEIVVLNNGALERVSTDMLHDKDFEQRIIHMLKEENHD